MGKLYAFLATLMFVVFVSMTSALYLNTKIDDTVEMANQKVDEYTSNVVEKMNSADNIENTKFRHKAYFANCFPNVCGKFSFASLSYVTKILSEKGTIEKQRVKYDLGTTAYFIVEYSPLTGKIFVEQNANNVILNKDNKKYATVFFNNLKYELSADSIEYYKALYSGDLTVEEVVEKLLGSSNLDVQGFKLAVEDYRFKTDVVRFNADITKNDQKTVSVDAQLDLAGVLSSDTDISTDAKMNFKVEDFSKDTLQEALVLAAGDQVALQKPQQSIEYMEFLLDTVKTLSKQNTNIKVEDVDLKLYKKSRNDELVFSLNGGADVALDKSLSPSATMEFNIKTQDQDIKDVLEQIKFPLRVNHQLVNVFATEAGGIYHTKIEAENGKLQLNEHNPISIKGLVKKYVETGDLLLGIAKMKMAQDPFRQ